VVCVHASMAQPFISSVYSADVVHAHARIHPWLSIAVRCCACHTQLQEGTCDAAGQTVHPDIVCITVDATHGEELHHGDAGGDGGDGGGGSGGSGGAGSSGRGSGGGGGGSGNKKRQVRASLPIYCPLGARKGSQQNLKCVIICIAQVQLIHMFEQCE
jgi:uncharacterized membrane protein YgcG